MNREFLANISSWYSSGEQVALAMVVETWGSSPRPPGALMAVSAGGQIAGSVSGGCVEGAVVAAALEVLDGGEARLLQFGVSDQEAWEVGLACGGSISVFVTGLPEPAFQALQSVFEAERPLALAAVLDGPQASVGHLLWTSEAESPASPREPEAAARWMDANRQDMLRWTAPRRTSVAADPPIELFINVIRPADRLIIVGGVHIARALADLASRIGFETIVVDPRRLFASESRFPGVDRLLQDWPQTALAEVGITASTAVAVLSHDPKIDDPAVLAALASPAFYIGVLGSRRTHAARVERLRAAGTGAEALARLHAPIGLNLGAATPEEIALAVLAEIIASKHGRQASG